MTNCINCNKEALTQYCGDCGQPQNVQRLNWRSLYEDFSSKWIGLDTLYGRTFIGMWVNPGQTIRTFLAGNRVKFLGPVSYYLITTALLVLLMALIDVNAEDFLKASQQAVPQAAGADAEAIERAAKLSEKANRLIGGMFRFMSILAAPSFALVFGWFYKKVKLTFLERMSVYAFIAGHVFYFTILQTILFKISGNTYVYYLFIFIALYASYAIASFYSVKPTFGAYLKSLSSYIVSMLLFMIVFSLLLVGTIMFTGL